MEDAEEAKQFGFEGAGTPPGGHGLLDGDGEGGEREGREGKKRRQQAQRGGRLAVVLGMRRGRGDTRRVARAFSHAGQ